MLFAEINLKTKYYLPILKKKEFSQHRLPYDLVVVNRCRGIFNLKANPMMKREISDFFSP
jgi:hypothetical protein